VRILYVCADRGIPLRCDKGASVHVRSITTALARLGQRVTVAVAREQGKNPPPTVERVEVLGADPERELDALIAAERCDCVIERYSLQSGAAQRIAERRGLPLLLEVNAPLVHEAARYRGLQDVSAALAREHELFCRASAIHVISPALSHYVRSVAPGARVHVVANGVEVERFATADPAPLTSAARRIVVGFVGSTKAWHGVADLLEAFAQLAPGSREAQRSLLLLVGGGPEEDRLRERARLPDLARRVLITGAVPHAEVPALTQAINVAVAPYLDTGDFYFSPLKILEYLAAGRPVVHPALGDLQALVGDAGLSYPPGDIAALAGALKRLIGDAQLRRNLGARAAERASAHSWESVARALVSIASSLPRPGRLTTAA
jgi:glycosyltransferase involved in cell wall biosynthesis